jgi:hypothetical protein
MLYNFEEARKDAVEVTRQSDWMPVSPRRRIHAI